MKEFFEYSMSMTMCGIPKVKLLGTEKDWKTLIEKVEGLDTYGLKVWVDALLPILNKFLLAYQGEVDTVFWDTCIKYVPVWGSGEEPYFEGWILNFFPFNNRKGAAFYDK